MNKNTICIPVNNATSISAAGGERDMSRTEHYSGVYTSDRDITSYQPSGVISQASPPSSIPGGITGISHAPYG